ncbi:GNAT family N-acetyltransferase [Bradyrhizobium sp. STM 3843]|uniref:GNAT family N-acetyltransferase n=1 Tax=Bradyrhizobium sp. STM 3843 TaxID=551947 RepID=UPI001FCB47D6|nr:GNAT family N-acetyltransferase [Bradyrhizobium sp. STM 3843]
MESSLFHEPWWLSAATNGQYEEAIVKRDTSIVGRLPYVTTYRGPFRLIRMPALTHILGPAVDAGWGKPQTKLIQRASITRALIDQLPPRSFFYQHIDPSLDDGLANVDGLVFQERKFSVGPQYTFEVDCRLEPSTLWSSMSQKTRQPIRRAEEKYTVQDISDPATFVTFYLANLKARGQRNRVDLANFPALFSECRTRQSGIILGAFDHDSTPIAMTFVVWGHGTMYYLLSTRALAADYGAVSLLLWTAMQEAHKLGLVLDLDGVYSSGTARFLSGFGGRLKTRLVIRQSQPPYSLLQLAHRYYARDETHYFT